MLVGCWPASRPAQVNVADLMGKRKQETIFCESVAIFFSLHSSSYISHLLKCFPFRYILEGKELEFYMKKIQRKKGKGAAA